MEHVSSVFDSPQDLPGALARFWDIAGIYQTQFTGFNSPSWDPNHPDTAAQGVFKSTDVFFEGWEADEECTCKLRLHVGSDDFDESTLNAILEELISLVNPPAAHRFDPNELSAEGFTYLSSWNDNGKGRTNRSLEAAQARESERPALRDEKAAIVAVSHDGAIGLGAVNLRRREAYYGNQHFRSEVDFSEPVAVTPHAHSAPLAIEDIPGARSLPIRREVKALAVSPDGSSIAVYEVNVEGGDNARLAIIDLEASSRRLVTTFDHGYHEVGLSFSPDGQWLLLNTRVWPSLINIEAGWSAGLRNVTGPACWWQINGRSALLEFGDFESQTAKLVDPGRIFCHDLSSGERLLFCEVKYPDTAAAGNRRQLLNPIAGANRQVLVGINFDVDDENDEYRYRVAVLDPETGAIRPLVERFADPDHQIERVHQGWAWNTPLNDDNPVIVSDKALGEKRAAQLDDDTPEEYAHWNLLALDFDSPLLTGEWDAQR